RKICLQDVFDEIIRSKAEITKSIKASEANIPLKIGALQGRLEQVEKENSRLKEKLEILERKKKSLIVFGLNEEPRDISLGSISETLKSLLKVEIKDTDISDLYSLGSPIKVEFTSYFKKKLILSKGSLLKERTLQYLQI
ncbi:hypothetical protein HHI36_016553, partial [Cryptolaemus montrouzieri]